MNGKHYSRKTNKAILLLLVSGAVNCGLAFNSDAQAPSRKPRTEETVSAGRTSPKIYEDDEVKIQIPAGWMIATGDHPAVAPYDGAGSSITQAKGRLLLAKSGYTLALAYHTEQASGVIGGRFIEVLRIPWLSADEAWDCSLHLGSYPQPASRTLTLMFMNTFFPTGDPEVREKCGIKKALSYWKNEGGTRQIVGEQRWFAGSFTTADGGWFFESYGTNCGKKAYTLTSKAKTPEELPVVGDPDLKKTVTEAIDIVASIHYKRCAPAAPQ